MHAVWQEQVFTVNLILQSRWRWRWCHHWIRVHFFFLTTKIGAGVKFYIALNIRWPSKYFLPFYIFHTHSQQTTWCSGSTNNSSAVSIHAERMLFQVTAFIPACCFFFLFVYRLWIVPQLDILFIFSSCTVTPCSWFLNHRPWQWPAIVLQITPIKVTVHRYTCISKQSSELYLCPGPQESFGH